MSDDIAGLYVVVGIMWAMLAFFVTFMLWIDTDGRFIR